MSVLGVRCPQLPAFHCFAAVSHKFKMRKFCSFIPMYSVGDIKTNFLQELLRRADKYVITRCNIRKRLKPYWCSASMGFNVAFRRQCLYRDIFMYKKIIFSFTRQQKSPFWICFVNKKNQLFQRYVVSDPQVLGWSLVKLLTLTAGLRQRSSAHSWSSVGRNSSRQVISFNDRGI